MDRGARQHPKDLEGRLQDLKDRVQEMITFQEHIIRRYSVNRLRRVDYRLYWEEDCRRRKEDYRRKAEDRRRRVEDRRRG